MSFLSVVLALRFRPMHLLVGGRCMGRRNVWLSLMQA